MNVPRGTSDEEAAQRAASSVGRVLTDTQLRQLLEYAGWLESEAIPAGGLGPRESRRLWERHIIDSLLFAGGFASQPSEILDVGTGVGLPGIPLAILWPETTVTLLDRGGRRIRLLHRVTRLLQLGNARIAQADVFDVADEWEALAFRASVKATEAVGLSARLLELGGTSVLGLSRRQELPESSRDLVSLATALGLNAEILDVGSPLFDDPAWLLIMRTDGGSQ